MTEQEFLYHYWVISVWVMFGFCKITKDNIFLTFATLISAPIALPIILGICLRKIMNSLIDIDYETTNRNT